MTDAELSEKIKKFQDGFEALMLHHIELARAELKTTYPGMSVPMSAEDYVSCLAAVTSSLLGMAVANAGFLLERIEKLEAEVKALKGGNNG